MKAFPYRNVAPTEPQSMAQFSDSGANSFVHMAENLKPCKELS